MAPEIIITIMMMIIIIITCGVSEQDACFRYIAPSYARLDPATKVSL